ncbi:MAG: hypothetical protein AAF215_10220 [Cyanobacteria bacterium P01_A01_bin.123]
MHMLVHRLSVSAAIVGLSVIAAGSAEAADVTRNFLVDIQTGGLADEFFFGSVTLDESLLVPAEGEKTVILSADLFSLEFDFLDTIFTEENDFFGFAALEITQYGNVVGLGYTVDSLEDPNAFFGFLPTDDSIGDEFFYDQFDAAGAVVDSGGGILKAVPEPGFAIALGILGMFGWVGRKSRQTA